MTDFLRTFVNKSPSSNSLRQQQSSGSSSSSSSATPSPSNSPLPSHPRFPVDTPLDISSHKASYLKHAKGRLWINIVEARNIGIPQSLNSKPYCVVEFERNEFVTKEGVFMNPHASHNPHAMVVDGQDVSSVSPVWKHEATFDVSRPDGHITITLWDRSNHTADPSSMDIDSETFLGMVKFKPSKANGKMHDNWYRLLSQSHKELHRGDIRIQYTYQEIKAKPLSAADFDLLKVVGKGSFGKVLQVRKKDTGRIYAMKILNKKDIIERQEVAHTLSERNVLVQANSPFLVGLKFSFQTPDKLYLVLDYMNGGELFYHLQKEQVFSEQRVKFYTAELVLALEHLHKHGIVYRDLKPENILLDSTGHIALTDFGLCKENLSFDQTTNTFCGTAEYLAPEVLTGTGYNKSVDWWSLGILLYEMTAGLPPFYSENVNVMYQKILHAEIQFPPVFSEHAKSLIIGLLTRDPSRRLGAPPHDAAAIKSHPFFANIQWDKLARKQIKPPFKPFVESEVDTSNFDPAFTSVVPTDSLPNGSTPLSETLQNEFKGFTYDGEREGSILHGSLVGSYGGMRGGVGSSYSGLGGMTGAGSYSNNHHPGMVVGSLSKGGFSLSQHLASQGHLHNGLNNGMNSYGN